MRLFVLALALGAFAIGTTELVTMGLLPEMAGTFHVSIPTAGWLVTAYALGVVVGAPILVAAALLALTGLVLIVVAERLDRPGRLPVDAAAPATEPAARVEAVVA